MAKQGVTKKDLLGALRQIEKNIRSVGEVLSWMDPKAVLVRRRVAPRSVIRRVRPPLFDWCAGLRRPGVPVQVEEITRKGLLLAVRHARGHMKALRQVVGRMDPEMRLVRAKRPGPTPPSPVPPMLDQCRPARRRGALKKT